MDCHHPDANLVLSSLLNLALNFECDVDAGDCLTAKETLTSSGLSLRSPGAVSKHPLAVVSVTINGQ